MTSECSGSCYLENPDVLIQICVRAGTDTLRLLSQTPLWCVIRTFADTRFFWFLRVQMLRDGLIWDSTVAWNDVWNVISFIQGLSLASSWRSYYATEEQFIQRCVVDRAPSALAIVDRKPSSNDSIVFRTCCYASAPSLMRDLLQSPYSSWREDCSRELYNACGRGDARVVEVLLSDGRADPAAGDSKSFSNACMDGMTEIVRLLLEDGRSESWLYRDRLIPRLRELGRHEIVRLLLDDKMRRAMPTIAHCLVVAILLLLIWM